MIPNKYRANSWLMQLVLTMIFLVVLNGTAAWGWTDNTTVNTPVSTAADYQFGVQIIADGSGGAITTWGDRRNGTNDIYAQKVDANGTVQWTTNGVVICDVNTYEYDPQLASDGAGGAIITWEDYRNGTGIYADIYAQRVNASGTALWTANGVAISTASGTENFVQIVDDGSGGAIITWQSSTGGLYAQRVNASGTALWTAGGVLVTSNSVRDPQLIRDGVGGAIITWIDFRNSPNRDIFSQKIDASGAVQWTVDGVAISVSTDSKNEPQITSDGSGGAIVAWYVLRSTSYDIYAQRINTTGTVQWTVNGVAISTATNHQAHPQLVIDGSGGAIITWDDSRNGSDSDIYAQRVNSTGTVQWTANGIAVSAAANDQTKNQLVADGSGGAVSTWSDDRNTLSSSDIYAQKIDSTGSAQWTVNGVAISTAANYQHNPQLAPDNSGGAIISWIDIRNGSNEDIYAQRIYANGTLAPTYTIGGSVSGLATGNSVVLQNNGADNLTVGANGNFTFATPLVDGSTYTVTVLTQPTTPDQVCTVTNEIGTLAGADVTNVTITCVDSYTIGGTVSGLAAGNSVELQNNGGDTLQISSGGSYSFATSLVNGSNYVVTVSTQPNSPNQTCTVSNGSGTIAGADVSNINIACVTNTYTVGGSVSGLATENNVVLQNNGGDNLTVNANGGFTFPALDDGSTYAVTVLTQPNTPEQTCTVTNGNSTLAGTNINNVSITCVTNTYTIGGSVSGLATGTNVMLQNNGGDTLTVNASGGFTFATALDDESTYTVTVLIQPATPSQICTVSNATGTLAGANISNVNIACVTNTYTIGGSISGLVTGTNVVLQNNGGDNLTVNASGGFTFATALDDESTYTVTVLTQPAAPSQICTVSNATGTLEGANISNVNIACVTNTYTISGFVSGLAKDTNVVLQNNGGDNLTVNANGSFTFATALDNESTYTVTVLTQPAAPSEICTISNATGTLAGANIMDVRVSCQTFPWTLFLPVIIGNVPN